LRGTACKQASGTMAGDALLASKRVARLIAMEAMNREFGCRTKKLATAVWPRRLVRAVRV
jgi:hypothetical protein